MSEYRGKSGRYLTEGLFYETAQPDSRQYIKYTLRPDDHNGFPSLYKIYMESTDEYDAAMTALGSFMHWEKLMRCKWFMEGRESKKGHLGFEGLNTWREHMKMRDESKAKKQLLQEAKNGSVAAQKTLYDSSRGKGAPKTQKPVQERTEASVESTLKERFNVIQGAKNG